MTQRIGQGGTISLDAVFTDGAGNLVDPVAPRVDILNPSDVELVTDAVPVNDSVGRYHYDYVVGAAAPLGVWTAHWTGTINGAAVEGTDLFEVVVAGEVEFTGNGFASVEQLEVYMGRTFTADETETASQVIDIVTAAIRTYTGQTFNFIDNDLVTLDGNTRNGLLLSELPVVAVNSVVEDGITLGATEYLLGYAGILYKQDPSTTPAYLVPWSRGIQNVVVNYDHGYTDIPRDIFGVTLSLASRLMSTVEVAGGEVKSETMGPYSITYTEGQASESFSSSELADLDRYRLPRVPVA